MAHRVWVFAGIGALVLAVSGCRPNDLGTPCHLLRSDGTEAEPRPGHTTVFSGSGECEEFACVSFDGAGAVCTKPCVSIDDPCPGDWACRSAILTPDQLQQLRARLEGADANGDGRDDFAEYVAGLSDSLYCGPPVD